MGFTHVASAQMVELTGQWVSDQRDVFLSVSEIHAPIPGASRPIRGCCSSRRRLPRLRPWTTWRRSTIVTTTTCCARWRA